MTAGVGSISVELQTDLGLRYSVLLLLLSEMVSAAGEE